MLGLREQQVTVVSAEGHWEADGWHQDTTSTQVIRAVLQPAPGLIASGLPQGEHDTEDWVMFVPRRYGTLEVAKDDDDQEGVDVVFTVPGGREIHSRIIWRRDWNVPGPYRYSVYGLKERIDQ